MNARLSYEGVMDNLSRYGVQFFGYKANPNHKKVDGEDLVVDVLQNYLTEEPRFVEALVKVIIDSDFDFKKLHDKAIKEDIGHRVHWLLKDYNLALEAEGLQDKAQILKKALPLFSKYTRSLEDEIASYSPGRQNWIRNSVSSVAKECGVPIVYGQDSLRDRVGLYCKSA